MSLSLVCSSCQARLKVRENLAGRKIKCPKCGQTLVVPTDEEPESAPPKASPITSRPRPVEEEEERPTRKRRSEEDNEETEEDEDCGRRRRRERDDREDDRPRPRRKRKAGKSGGKGLLIVLLAGGGLVVLLLGGVLLAFYFFAGGSDIGGSWPEPMPVRGMNFPPDSTAIFHVSNVRDEYTREVFSQRLGSLFGGNTMVSSCQGDRMTVKISPVLDLKALADKIDFGTVRSVSGRTITVVAQKVEGPGPNADKLTKALFFLKMSPQSVQRRDEFIRIVKGKLPDEAQRGEVNKMLESLLAPVYKIFVQ